MGLKMRERLSLPTRMGHPAANEPLQVEGSKICQGSQDSRRQVAGERHKAERSELNILRPFPFRQLVVHMIRRAKGFFLMQNKE